ncbi:hypothetical protein PALB_24960 [Pseudoalteromonas luteoviolacea B = ATCC 29581]|nr:hypothetical protein PALB_24960 [Pseudoalteromonas luteoviolacea B = ATCC 29581]
MDRSLSLMFLSILVLGAGGLAFANSDPLVKSSQLESTINRECALLRFESVNENELTKAERLALEEGILENGLNATARCNDEHFKALDERQQQAATQTVNGAAVSSESTAQQHTTDKEQLDEAKEQSQSKANSSSQSSKSKEHVKGQKGQGSSAVCQAVMQGLGNAQTESEKQHFDKLAKEYGCKG